MNPERTPTVALATLRGADIGAIIGELAHLRITVFREWPYLYDGDASYEERYLGSYAMSERAVVVVARATGPDGTTRIVGASTALPARDEALCQGLRAHGFDPERTCYFGESVLLPAWRGQGVGVRFFEAREQAARAWGATLACFAAVERDPNDPRRPKDYVPLDAFWQKRGFQPVDGLALSFGWKEVGHDAETPHRLPVWAKVLAP